MQFDERVHRYPAGADLHACARDRIEHPRRYNRDDAGLRFDLHEPPRATLLAAAEANATPEEGMPAIMDHDFLPEMPEMGRMTRRWPAHEVVMHGAARGQVLGQGAPLAARAQDVEHCVEHL